MIGRVLKAFVKNGGLLHKLGYVARTLAVVCKERRLLFWRVMAEGAGDTWALADCIERLARDKSFREELEARAGSRRTAAAAGIPGKLCGDRRDKNWHRI